MTSELGQRASAKLNWIWIAVCAFVGCAAIGVAWLLVRDDEESIPDFWSGVLINVGTSILLAGVVFWLERRFVRQTNEVALSAATTAATETAAQTTAARIQADEQLYAKISELEERLEKQRSEQVKADNEALHILNEDASYDSVFVAMKNALQIGAITRDGLTVPAGQDATAPRVNIAYRQAWRNEDGDGQEEGLEFSFIRNREPNGAYNIFGVTESWHEEQDPTRIFNSIMDQMISKGYGLESRQVKIEPFFRHLARALPQAVSARRGEPDAWQSSGSLLEIIQEGWVITENGLEVEGRGLILEAELFQDDPSFLPQPALSWEKPKQPDWADSDLWDVAMLRARAVLSGRSTWS